jgi:MipA family protein
MNKFIAVALAGSAGLITSAGFAAQAGGLADAGMPDGVRVTLGLGAGARPAYEGAANYRPSIWPIVTFKAIGGSLDRFEAKSLDDLAFSLIKHDGFDIGVLGGYRYGRHEADAVRLWGTGDIQGGLVGGGFIKYSVGQTYVRASVHHSISGDDTGGVLRLATGTEFRPAERVLMKATVWADVADSTYMTTFFGVSALQSARSGLTAYDAGAGLKSLSVALSTDLMLNADWTLMSSIGYSRLIGDAADSPIVSSADQFNGRVGLARSFDWRWR